MINELHNLAKTLDSRGISSNEWHREYKPIPKVTPQSPCIRIWLGDDGSICGMESLTSLNMKDCKTSHVWNMILK